SPTVRARRRGRRPRGCAWRPRRSLLAEVPCRDDDALALRAQAGGDGLADRDGAVLAARAAHGDGHVALLLPQGAGQARLERADVPVDELEGPGPAEHVVAHRGDETGEVEQLGDTDWVCMEP